MSRVLKHTRCPRCAELGKDRRGNNLAVYEDGHSYCFGCSYYGHPPNSVSRMKHKLLANYKLDTERHYESNHVSRNYRLPSLPLTWLRKYGINDEEIRQHSFFWDNEKSLLVMPVTDGDRIVYVNARYFGTNKDHPKYVGKGYKHGHYKLIPKESSNVYVLVEDYLSAIRVGRFANAIPLFGTFCPRELILSLLSKQPILRFWLDRDKAIEAAKQAARTRQWIPNCATIVTEKDPKEYTDDQIRNILNESILFAPESFPQS